MPTVGVYRVRLHQEELVAIAKEVGAAGGFAERH